MNVLYKQCICTVALTVNIAAATMKVSHKSYISVCFKNSLLYKLLTASLHCLFF